MLCCLKVAGGLKSSAVAAAANIVKGSNATTWSRFQPRNGRPDTSIIGLAGRGLCFDCPLGDCRRCEQDFEQESGRSPPLPTESRHRRPPGRSGDQGNRQVTGFSDNLARKASSSGHRHLSRAVPLCVSTALLSFPTRASGATGHSCSSGRRVCKKSSTCAERKSICRKQLDGGGRPPRIDATSGRHNERNRDLPNPEQILPQPCPGSCNKPCTALCNCRSPVAVRVRRSRARRSARADRPGRTDRRLLLQGCVCLTIDVLRTVIVCPGS